MKLLNRKSSRASWHEYNGGDYFVTICTKNRNHYFGKIVDGAMQLTAVGEYLKLQIENTEIIRNGDVTIPLYTIMPNHVHLIVSIYCGDALRASDICRTHAVRPHGGEFGTQTKNLASVIRGIKCSVTKYANDNQIPFGWQSRYHDHIIRNQNEMNRISKYIENNPLIWWRDRNNIR